MLAPDHAVTEVTLPAIDLRALARRAAVPALAVLAVTGVVLLAGGPIHAFADAVRRGLDASPAWALVGIGFECVSLAGYVALLSLVATRATPRIGARGARGAARHHAGPGVRIAPRRPPRHGDRRRAARPKARRSRSRCHAADRSRGARRIPAGSDGRSSAGGRAGVLAVRRRRVVV